MAGSRLLRYSIMFVKMSLLLPFTVTVLMLELRSQENRTSDSRASGSRGGNAIAKKVTFAHGVSSQINADPYEENLHITTVQDGAQSSTAMQQLDNMDGLAHLLRYEEGVDLVKSGFDEPTPGWEHAWKEYDLNQIYRHCLQDLRHFGDGKLDAKFARALLKDFGNNNVARTLCSFSKEARFKAVEHLMDLWYARALQAARIRTIRPSRPLF